MTRLAIFSVACWCLILTATWFAYQPVAMRAAGTALVTVGYYLIGSAG